METKRTEIRVYATTDPSGTPIVRTVGPHKVTYREYATLSSARAAARRLARDRKKLEKFHYN